MKSLKITAFALALAAFTFGAQAQTKSTTTTPGPRLSIGVDGGIPTGTLSNAYNWNLGGSAQLELPVASQLFFTVNAGYNNIFGKKNYTTSATVGTTTVTATGDVQNIQVLPAKVGLKFFPISNFYVQAEGGAGFLLNKKDLAYTKSTAFIYAPQIGVLLPLNTSSNLDLGVRYEGSTKYATADNSTINFVGLHVAYSFNL